MHVRASLLFIVFILVTLAGIAQTIRGEVLDMNTKKTIADVNILNVHTSLEVSSSADGAFVIAASSGQLLEFRKNGYKTVRVRIPQGYVPSYFRIIIEKGIPKISETNVLANNRYDYRQDSIRFRQLYGHELDMPKLSAFDMIAHPFSALSGKNREVWQFQDDYADFEKEKYVDRTFNEDLVTRVTGLTGDSLHYFMRRYRPTYEQIRSMNDYTFFTFIKSSVYRYRHFARPATAQ